MQTRASKRGKGVGPRASARSRFQSGSLPWIMNGEMRALLVGEMAAQACKAAPTRFIQTKLWRHPARPIAWKLASKAFLSRENHLRVKGPALLELHVLGDNPVDIMDVK